VAGAIGPFVGGGLVDGPGWRWAFLINVPVGALAIACARAAVPETRDPHASRGLDLGGAAVAVIGLAAGTWALTEAGRRGWTDHVVLVAEVLAVVAIATFVWHMLRSSDPLVPPALFANRTFTVVNLATALLYGALGLSFFLVAYELQVGTGWSALKAGTALLPATVLMLVGSAASGSVAQRIGPRLQLTLGPPLAGAGLLLLTRIGPNAHWATDVLPGALVFGLGLVTFVAPLTATVMAASHPDHVSVASGVNNAIARAASLAALAAIPGLAGLTRAVGPVAVTHAFRIALVIAACGAVTAGALAFIGLGTHVRAPRTARRVHCSIDGTPLQPQIRQGAENA
jgi:predicted MFS family arabinose efflux permease